MSEPRSSETVVTLSAMRFHARIGVLPHEAEIAQSVEVDLSLRVARAHGEIGPHNILDYRHAYELVSSIITAGHIRYLEEAAERIAESALEISLIAWVRVSVRKPNVALPGPLAYAEVTVERRRE